jgi:group II intron reverse transcriptase/maturase
MRNPIIVLETLSEKSIDSSYKYERLYRNLYNPEFYCLAYQNIYANNGSMTPGSDNETIDGMSLKRIDKIIASMKDHSYQPKPARRTYITKKNGKLRPLGIPSADDKLVQEVVRMILESIYEPTFSKNSHGFRTEKSCHTALSQIQHSFTGVRWFIEGDIEACFDSFDHHVLVNILRKKIADEYLIALIWKLLKAGYMEQWTYNRTYSGTPQGSGVSPLLANIYLNELDAFMEQYKENFNKGQHAKRNQIYRRESNKLHELRRKNATVWNELDEQSKAAARKEQRKQKHIVQSLPPTVVNDPQFKRVQYCRYADDFIVGVIGSKQDAETIKAAIGQFLREKLKLTMSDEKSKITHAKDKARFLGYDITIRKNAPLKRNKNGKVVRSGSRQIMLYVPFEKWRNKLLDYKAMKICKDANGGERWKPIHRAFLAMKPDIEIITKINAEIRGLYNYYKLAHNVSVLSKFAYIMEYSMYKTFGCKYKKSVRFIKTKYFKNGEFSIPYDTKTGKKYCVFHNTGFGRKEIPFKGEVDVFPRYINTYKFREQVERLKAGICELCGKENTEIYMHHVKKLKDLTGQSEWVKQMKKKRRKSLAVCFDCHEFIHKST